MGWPLFGENSFFRDPGCRSQETCAGCPQQWYATGEPGKDQGRNRLGIVEGSCGYRALAAVRHWRARQCSGTGLCVDCRRVPWVQRPGISIRGKIVLSRNPGYKTRGVAMRLNVAYPDSLPEVKYQVRNLVRVVGITDPLPHGQSAQYSGKIRFIELQGVNGHTTPMPCPPPQQWYDAGESGKVQGRDIVGIEEGSCGYRSRVVSIRGTFDISRNPGYKTGGLPCG